MDEVLDPGVVGVPVWRRAVLPTGVALDLAGAPRLEIERRVGEDEVRAQARELVVEQAVPELDVAAEPVDGEVHPPDPPCGLIVLLTVDSDRTCAAAVGLDE